ncbi:MAG: sulfotransferase family protein [Gammaproteobacteria bacterium]
MLDFLCIGAQKAGTSWLHAQLVQHPGVAFPAGKEAHYWDWVQRGKRADDIEAYRRKFADVPGKRLGDMTPAYAVLEARYVEQIRTYFPDVRILFVLRNPIERAWAAARMVLEEAQLEGDEVDESWYLPLLRSRASQARGDYETTLRRWRSIFPAEQIRVLFYDDLGRDPRAVLRTVAEHVGIDPAPLERLDEARLQRRVRAGPSVELPDALRSELVALYRERIESLGRYLGADLGHWLDGSHSAP